MTNDVEILEMAKIFEKWLRYMGHGFSIENRHKYVANDLNIFSMALICGKLLKYIRNGYTVLEMA